MSLILEALQKSEQERNIGRVPGLDAAVLAHSHNSARRWKWAALGILLINICGAGLYVLAQRGLFVSDPIAATSLPSSVASTLLPPPPSAELLAAQAPLSPAATAPVVEPRLDDIDAVRRHEQTRLSRQTPRLPTPVATQVVAPPPPVVTQGVADEMAPAPAFERPPVAAQASSQDPILPEMDEINDTFSSPLVPLRLDVHVFSPQVDERFVFINMTKYYEGEQIREGPRVAAIENQGVVLEYQGQRFLLTAQ